MMKDADEKYCVVQSGWAVQTYLDPMASPKYMKKDK
jgi:hypothetical protein